MITMADKEITDVEGISEAKAESLKEAGYTTVDSLRKASQEQLSEVEGIGKALSARIKADVGGLEVEDVETAPEPVTESEEEEEKESVSAAELSDKSPDLSDEEWTKIKKRLRGGSSKFRRQDYHKKKRLPESWRSPDGSHSKHRKQKKSRGRVAGIGHRSPTLIRGRHPSGFEEVLVHTPDEVSEIDPDSEAIRIGGSVGGRKRERIEEEALKQEVRVLNPTYPEEGEE